ncbi:XdhC family protein [Clostridiaceae bacterium 35-E11]
MKEIMNQVLELLEQNESFVLAMVIDQSGSTPRGAGAKMIVRKNKEILGTIGGGLVEAQVQKQAQEIFENKKTMIKTFHLNQKEAAEMHMICGGELTVLAFYVDASDPKNKAAYRGIWDGFKENKKSWMVTIADGKDEICQVLIKDDGTIIGTLKENVDAQAMKEHALATKKYKVLRNEKSQIWVIEPVVDSSKAYICGAGHVAYKTQPLLNYVGFYTVVMDDREKFANKERFKTADEIVVLDSFDAVFDKKHIDQDSYIIIVTRGHEHDKTVLSQAMKTNARYIGMIGSRKKIAGIYEALLKEGFTMKDLKKIYSPIGIAIEAETPEEIAVSITAELIQVRAKANAVR